MSKHSRESAIRTLTKKKDIQIVDNTIYIRNDGNDLPGNKSWGKIGYLMHYHSMECWKVKSLPKELKKGEELNLLKRVAL